MNGLVQLALFCVSTYGLFQLINLVERRYGKKTAFIFCGILLAVGLIGMFLFPVHKL